MSNLKNGSSIHDHNKIHSSDSFEINNFIVLDHYKFQNKSIIVKDEHAVNIINYHDYQVYSCTVLNSTCFTTPSRVEISIPPHSNDVLVGSPWLLLKLSESGGTNTVTPCSVALMFDRVEIMYGGRILQTLNGDELYVKNLTEMEAEERDLMESYMNVSIASIAASGKAVYMMKLACFNESH